MKLKFCVCSIILMACSMAAAEVTTNLPANSRIFLSEEDCIAVIQSHYSWNIEFAASLREMEKSGKLIRYPEKLPITILETKKYRSHHYYKISIDNRQTKQQDIVWTDTVRFE